MRVWLPTSSVRKPCLCGWPAGSGTRGTGCWQEAAPSAPRSGIRFPSPPLRAAEERRGERQHVRRGRVIQKKSVEGTHTVSYQGVKLLIDDSEHIHLHGTKMMEKTNTCSHYQCLSLHPVTPSQNVCLLMDKSHVGTSGSPMVPPYLTNTLFQTSLLCFMSSCTSLINLERAFTISDRSCVSAWWKNITWL